MVLLTHLGFFKGELILFLDDIKFIIEDIHEIEPLTNVIGIKCNQEIILASDSQLIADQMKTLAGSKLF
jgi:hypothetical protein